MKNMKLYMLCGVLVLGLAACQAQKESVAPLPTGEAAVEAQASVFQSLRMANGNALAVSLEATPTETETPFFYIEAARDTEVTLYYNFTKEAGDAQIGCYADGSKEKMSVPLDSSSVTEEVNNEMTISLQKGMNVFYITGDGCSCNVSCEISGLDEKDIYYADTKPKDIAP